MSETEMGLSLAAVAAAIAVFIINRVRPSTPAEIPEILQRLTKVETRQEIYMKFLDKTMADAFHSPHTPEIDRLLEKMRDSELSHIEKHNLLDMIKEEMKTLQPKSSEFIAGAFLVASLESQLNC